MTMSIGVGVPGLYAPLPVRVERARNRSIAQAAAVSATTEPLAFAAFYEQNVDGLIRALSAALVDSSLAADAAQEALTRACERWSTVQHHPNPTAWCFRVGMNWSTSRWRKRQREVSTAEPRSNATVADIEPRNDALLAALMKLNAEQRCVVVLRVWMDWSVEATAEALGLAPGTVASRQHRGLAKLRKIMTADSHGSRSTPEHGSVKTC